MDQVKDLACVFSGLLDQMPVTAVDHTNYSPGVFEGIDISVKTLYKLHTLRHDDGVLVYTCVDNITGRTERTERAQDTDDEIRVLTNWAASWSLGLP